MLALDISNFSDNAPSRWSTHLFFFIDSKSLLFQLVEILELPLSLTDNKELLSIYRLFFVAAALNGEWILPVLLEIDVLVLRQT
jgi:hypothetical protein